MGKAQTEYAFTDSYQRKWMVKLWPMPSSGVPCPLISRIRLGKPSASRLRMARGNAPTPGDRQSRYHRDEKFPPIGRMHWPFRSILVRCTRSARGYRLSW